MVNNARDFIQTNPDVNRRQKFHVFMGFNYFGMHLEQCKKKICTYPLVLRTKTLLYTGFPALLTILDFRILQAAAERAEKFSPKMRD